jgi:hypothetical protein
MSETANLGQENYRPAATENTIKEITSHPANTIHNTPTTTHKNIALMFVDAMHRK